MKLLYRIAADTIVVVHAAYVGFVIVGLLLILLGILFRWQWIRNFWFRLTHLLMIAVVVAEAWFGIVCPLTTWEQRLRKLAGSETYEGDFLAKWVHELLFFDAPPWVFTLCYSLFGTAVLATFLIAPPRRPSRRNGRADPVSAEKDSRDSR
jgi:hypothetical protein